MRARLNSGQILPLACILCSTLIFFIAANFQRSRLEIDKMERQTKADALAMRIANEQARALNAVAALNDGLSVILNRIYLYSITWTGACGCAAASLGLNETCDKACISLSRDSKEFFGACSDMGEKIAEWQDKIVRWGDKAPANMTSVALNPWVTLSEGSRITFVGERNKTQRLLIHRGGSDAFKAMGVNDAAAGVAVGKDYKNCKTSRIDSSGFAKLERIRSGLGVDDEFRAYFMSTDGTNVTFDRTDILPRTSTFFKNRKIYVFDHAIEKRCTSLQHLLNEQNGGLPFRFSIPKPYVLEPNFWTDQKVTLQVLTITKPTDIAPLFEKNDKPSRLRLFPAKIYAEARVEGSSLDKMDFQPTLSKITELQNENLIH